MMQIKSKKQQQQRTTGINWLLCRGNGTTTTTTTTTTTLCYSSYCTFNCLGVIFCVIIVTIVVTYSRYLLLEEDIQLDQRHQILKRSSTFFASLFCNNSTIQLQEENNNRNQHLPHQVSHRTTSNGTSNSNSNSTSTSNGSTSRNRNHSKSQRQKDAIVHYSILAYGDSLTDGMVRVGSPERWPYAPYLQDALQTIRKNTTASSSSTTATVVDDVDDTTVYYRGNPGWTATDMLQNIDHPDTGLVPFIEQHLPTQKQQKQLSSQSIVTITIVILLVGTNDLGQEHDLETIINEIQQLHEQCFHYGVNYTIALSIPSSGYQHRNTEAAKFAFDINNRIQKFCNNSNNTITYVPFPIDYDPNSDNWSVDTLHLSKIGYQLLGELLAPIVNTVIEKSARNTKKSHL